MTEREKMELGMWYDANNDEELLKQRVLAKDLCFDLDHIKPSSYEKRLEVITSLFVRLSTYKHRAYKSLYV